MDGLSVSIPCLPTGGLPPTAWDTKQGSPLINANAVGPNRLVYDLPFGSLTNARSRFSDFTRTVCAAVRSALRAKSAHEKDDKADQQNKAKSPTADCRTAKVEATAAEQKEKNNHQ